MAVLGWLALALAVLGLGFCFFLYIEVSKRVLTTAVYQMLKQYADELSKESQRNVREIETEWTDMYQKFSRLAGRMDREKRPSIPVEAPELPPPPPVTRHELLRRWRNRG